MINEWKVTTAMMVAAEVVVTVAITWQLEPSFMVFELKSSNYWHSAQETRNRSPQLIDSSLIFFQCFIVSYRDRVIGRAYVRVPSITHVNPRIVKPICCCCCFNDVNCITWLSHYDFILHWSLLHKANQIYISIELQRSQWNVEPYFFLSFQIDEIKIQLTY